MYDHRFLKRIRVAFLLAFLPSLVSCGDSTTGDVDYPESRLEHELVFNDLNVEQSRLQTWIASDGISSMANANSAAANRIYRGAVAAESTAAIRLRPEVLLFCS